MQTKTILGLFLVLVIAACGGAEKSEKKEESNAGNLTKKERQYFTNGKRLYESICAQCHMEEGQGLGKLIPPLQKSDYLLNNVSGAARVIKFGLKGPVTVNGTEYNQPMPANPRLKDLEIAEILTYITNSWGNAHGGVTLEDVAEGLKEK